MNEIKLLLKDIWKNKGDYLFLFWQLYYFAGISEFATSNESLIVNLFICLFFLLYKKKTIEKKLFIILAGTVLINLIAVAHTGYVNYFLLSGFLIRVIIAYLIIRSFEFRFFIYFENLIFVLALISLPLFLIQIAAPNFFNIFKIISFVTPQRENAGHIDLFIYNFNAWAVFRNSGFMWEPAAFGAVLAWAAIVNVYRKGYSFNIRKVVFLMAMITTFSLGTYTYLLFFLFSFLLENQFKRILLGVLLAITVFIIAANITFLGDQIEHMYNKYEVYETSTSIVEGKTAEQFNVSRTQGFLLDIDYFIKWPFGYGWYRNNTDLINMAGSPNGFGRFLINWGIVGLVFLVVSYNRYLHLLNRAFKYKIKYNIIFLIIFILTLNGNPIDQKPFFLAFAFSGFILYNRTFKNPIKHPYKKVSNIRRNQKNVLPFNT